MNPQMRSRNIRVYISSLEDRVKLLEASMHVAIKAPPLQYNDIRPLVEDFQLVVEDPNFESVSKSEFLRSVLARSKELGDNLTYLD